MRSITVALCYRFSSEGVGCVLNNTTTIVRVLLLLCPATFFLMKEENARRTDDVKEKLKECGEGEEILEDRKGEMKDK